MCMCCVCVYMHVYKHVPLYQYMRVCDNVSVFNIMLLCSQIFQFGETALMWASGEGRTDVVEVLIKHGADVNARTEVRG